MTGRATVELTERIHKRVAASPPPPLPDDLGRKLRSLVEIKA